MHEEQSSSPLPTQGISHVDPLIATSPDHCHHIPQLTLSITTQLGPYLHAKSLVQPHYRSPTTPLHLDNTNNQISKVQDPSNTPSSALPRENKSSKKIFHRQYHIHHTNYPLLLQAILKTHHYFPSIIPLIQAKIKHPLHTKMNHLPLNYQHRRTTSFTSTNLLHHPIFINTITMQPPNQP